MLIEKKIKQRNINIDLIRCIAVFSVLGVHFFLQTSFYYQPMIGKMMFFQTIVRTFFMICVPLFLTLTGYLMNRKELSKHYYKGIIQVLGIYLLASLACVAYNVFIDGKVYGITEFITGFTDFKFANYSWYVNMYIGLFLLIPFLNMIWNNRNDKKHHLFLVATLLMITAFPTISSTSILPDWWMGTLYPITYYFIGAYLKDHDLHLKWFVNLGLLIICVVGFGAYNFYYSHPGEFAMTSAVDWQGYQSVINTVLVFLLILHLPLQKIPYFAKYLIYKISECSFGIYLVSSIFDHIFYPILPSLSFIIPLLVFICSWALSQVLLWIYNLIIYLCVQVKSMMER